MLNVARFSASALLLLSTALPALAQAPAGEAAKGAPLEISIPTQEFTLPNGLRVIVHTDKRVPVVAVNIWYHVGSRNERAGRTGFAHLFEHLMFQESENHRDEFLRPFELVGRTDQNGTTFYDRTNYYETVPSTALDMALWMESDRMGHLLGAIDQKALDEQRGVVQNEKRQRQGVPYGMVSGALFGGIYPGTHPYHHEPIGSMADLDAASLDDVKAWFKSWYGPNNAVLVLSGDVDLATAKEKVTRYFGDIAPSASLPDLDENIPDRPADTREVLPDAVAQPAIFRGWATERWGGEHSTDLALLAYILGGSDGSRLNDRLVRRDQLATTVNVAVQDFELSQPFTIQLMVRPGVDPAKAEAALDDEMRRIIEQGPTAQEVELARTAQRAAFARSLETVGGRADLLNECATYLGRADCWQEDLKRLNTATPASVQAAARRWLAKGSHTVVVQPSTTPAAALVKEEPSRNPPPMTIPAPDPRYHVIATDVDRTKGMPATTTFPALKLPEVGRATLSNGTKVAVIERHGTPLVSIFVDFPGGQSSDGVRAGRANLAMTLLDDGFDNLDGLAFQQRLQAVGAEYQAFADRDYGLVYVSGLADKLAPTLDLVAGSILQPRFAPPDLERERANALAGIRQQKANPARLATRILAPAIYGGSHPYGVPNGGTEAGLAAITRDDLLAFQRDWLRPDHAQIVVIGDTTLGEVVPLLEARIGKVKPAGAAPAIPSYPAVAPPARPRVLLIDRPGSPQSMIQAGVVIPPTVDPVSERIDMVNGVLGGQFTSRINMNLRETKHWSYGVSSIARDALGQRLWLVQAPVQTDRTADSMREMFADMDGLAKGTRPVKPEELDAVRTTRILMMPGLFESALIMGTQLMAQQRFGRPNDYLLGLKARLTALNPGDLDTAARVFDPAGMTWVVVGDLAKIEAPIRALNLGEVTVVDADGKPVR